MNSSTLLEREAREAPACVARLIETGLPVIDEIARRCRERPPKFAMTVARGSSNHAATYGRYLIESRLGLPSTAAMPSVVTLYGAHLRLADALAIGVSQSGASPDLTAVVADARGAGAQTIAIVNQTDSPLARAAQLIVPLAVGEEAGIAATKSCIAQMAAFALLVARLADDAALQSACHALPAVLEEAAARDWTAAVAPLAQARHLYVVARGAGLGVAGEWALKCKETAGLFAEAVSAAELLHGPVAMVGRDFPLLLLALADETQAAVLGVARRLGAHGAQIIVASSSPAALAHGAVSLPLPPAPHPALAPIVAAQAFYPLLARLAAARGHDPDRPTNLVKITQTL